MSSYRLPSEDWKFKQSLFSNFNNQLLAGHNQGLSLYNYDTDTNLYKNTDTKPLDAVSFDVINNDLDKYDNNYNKQDDIYHNSKASISGAISAIGQTGDDYIQRTINEIKKLFTFDTSGLKTYGGLFILFIR